MSTPRDIARLSTLLPQLGIEEEFVEKACAYLEVDPSSEQRWGGVAVDYRNAGKFFAADAVFAAALDRFPDSALMWQSRGDLFRRWEKNDGALALFQRSLELDPGAPGPLVGLGLLYEQTELYAEAAEWYRRYLDLRPDNAMAHTNLANCYRQLGRRDDAARHYVASLESDPTHRNALFSYAAFLYEQRAFDEALKLVDRLLGLEPGDEGARELRAEIKRRPSRPRRVGKQSLTNHPLILRGSPNYGWQGPARKASVTLTEADLSAKGLLRAEDLSKLGTRELRSKVGYRTADVLELDRLVRERAAEETLPSPTEQPILFLSYRRSSAEHGEWMKQLASDLLERGYQVALDEFLTEALPELTVPALVSRMAACNLFVPVLTNAYARAVEPDGLYTDHVVGIGIGDDAWVFDEMRTARQLLAMGRMQWLPLWRSGTMLPSPFYEGNVVDVRGDRRYAAALDRYFPA